MSTEFVLSIAREALTTALLLAAPVLGLSLVVGVAISIFQATTQIQEQTLTFVPKILAALVGILFFGAWMLNTLVTYAAGIFGNLATLVR
ncbi:MAG: flagellar biosynthesis protein FliQ [Clostridia bacterium]|nr:flagellar biosynthesis protein FliQ [Clostridia bacterium]